MGSQTQAFRQYLKRREDAINVKKAAELQAIDLYNEKTFYDALVRDMLSAKKEVIIFSPYASKFRTDYLKPTIEKLIDRNIDIFIFTRPIDEYEHIIQPQIECALKRFENMGVSVLYPGKYIHQKVAIIDREILWDGSLNILSHRASNEMMRRTVDVDSALQVMSHIGLNDRIAAAYKLKYEKLYKCLAHKSKLSFMKMIKIYIFGLISATIMWIIVWILLAKPFSDIHIIEYLFRMIAK